MSCDLLTSITSTKGPFLSSHSQVLADMNLGCTFHPVLGVLEETVREDSSERGTFSWGPECVSLMQI